jgi:predicted small secreted protein
MKRSLIAIIFIASASLLLTGCSGMRIVDSDVTAFSSWSSAPPAPYRFERLPSQQSGNPQQERLETIARNSLAKVGMVLEPAKARFGVQITFNTQYLERFPDDGFLLGGPGVFMGAGTAGSSFGFSYPIRFGEPYYKRDLTLLMRDLATQKVVFETRAFHDGVWGDTLAVLPAMLDAALLGFPQPPQGKRRINVEIPR